VLSDRTICREKKEEGDEEEKEGEGKGIASAAHTIGCDVAVPGRYVTPWPGVMVGHVAHTVTESRAGGWHMSSANSVTS
jgi:hypothetical protein